MGGKRLKVKLRAGKNAEWQAAQTPIICDVRSFIFFSCGNFFFVLGSVVRSYMRKWGTFDKWRRMGLDGVYV